MDVLLQIIIETAFQIIVEICIAIFEHTTGRKIPEDTNNRSFKFLIYISVGMIIGFGSLFIFPQGVINNETLKIMVLISSPILTGLAMGLIGNWRRNHDKTTVEMESFTNGFVMAFSISLIRYIWAV